MLLEQVREELSAALKAREQDKVRTLRFLLSEIHNLETAKYPPEKGGLPATGLPDEDVLLAIQKLVKTHKESIAAFNAGKRQDLVEKETRELEMLQKYLPSQLSEEEIRKTVEEAKARGFTDFGQIMKEVMAKLRGGADGSMVAKVVKDILKV